MKIEIKKASSEMKRYAKFQNPSRGSRINGMCSTERKFWQYILFGYSIMVLFKRVKL